METVVVMDDAPLASDSIPVPGLAPGSEAPSPKQIAPSIEAILLTADRPITAARLAEALGLAPPPEASPDDPPEADVQVPKPRRRPRKAAAAPDGAAQIEAAIAALNEAYAASGRSFRIESVAGGYRIMTLPEFAPALAAFHKSRSSSRLSRAAVETLAIIAYKQPLTRAHLESIRGVACGEVLRSLIERRLITIKGRAEELGRPILYGTTKDFLDAFGLASLKDLPSATDLQVNP